MSRGAVVTICLILAVAIFGVILFSDGCAEDGCNRFFQALRGLSRAVQAF
ncbi:hypothetical protein Q4577_09125 [Marinovum sp. 2_MG-2023]|nr:MULTISPECIES: hypothetical protein [Roseobacteraceae]MCJ7874208.1 hypothetical protein [Phaeobacter sp. J2-8]MDO6730180.1 hypothetical protein [Marinovum sp. 2_MG-2023]MDO6778918.1 hypothetical protein [Marinovum sp. 1_MG-2023]